MGSFGQQIGLVHEGTASSNTMTIPDQVQRTRLRQGGHHHLHQHTLVIAPTIDDKDLACPGWLCDDVLNLYGVVPELEMSPVQAFVPRVDDLQSTGFPPTLEHP